MATQLSLAEVLAKGAVIGNDYKRGLLVTTVGAVTTYATVRLVRSLVRRHALRLKCREKQADTKQAIEEMYFKAKREITTADVKKIVNLEVSELALQLKDGRLKPIHALRAFQVQAYEVNKTTNCILEPILEAEQWAIDLENCSEKGPLYGIPISVKENLPLKGYDSAKGCSALIGHPFTENCVMVEVLRKQGAVPFVRTNMPQLGLSLESSQPIGGTTLNPHDPTRGPGGSSSGEAVMVTTRGSPLGVGSDTGGSIRCPAAMCGVTAIKPSFSRVSLKGRADFPGNTIVMSTTSPIARTVEDVAFLLKAIFSPHLWDLDFNVAPIPFNNQEYLSERPLKIGYFVNNGILEPVPAVVRAVMETKEALESMGHEVVPWNPPDFAEGFYINITSLFGDGGQGLCGRVKDDVKDRAIESAWNAYMMPLWMRRLVSWMIKPFDPNLSRHISMLNGVGSCADWWKLNLQHVAYKQKVAQWWTGAGLDALLCPAFGFPAMPLGSSYEMIFGASYDMPFNVLDYACGVVPVTKVTRQDQELLMDEYPTSNKIYRNVKKGMKGAEGLPVAVQIAVPTWRDETCLRVMREIETHLKNKKK